MRATGKFNGWPPTTILSLVRQLGLVSPPQRQKPSVQKKKCNRKKCREHYPLKSETLPEHIPVTERPEPKGIDVIR